MIGKGVPVSEKARRLHFESLVLDCHSHFLINGTLFKRRFHITAPKPRLYNPFKNAMDLDSLVKGGVKAVTFTTYVPGRPLLRHSDSWTDRVIDRYWAILDECGGRVEHCNCADEIEAAVAHGKLASLLAIEGAHVLEGRIENIRHFYDRGVRMMTLTHFLPNGVADGTLFPFLSKGGLTAFGREVVAEMNSVGMMVDVAHCTDKGIMDVLKASRTSPIFSHGGLRRNKAMQRNLSDDAARAIGAAGGLVGIIFFPRYLGRAGKSVRGIAHQARDLAELVGTDKICLGSDMDGFTWTPRGFRDASDWPQVTQALMDEGFSDHEIRGILGMNFLRYFRTAVSPGPVVSPDPVVSPGPGGPLYRRW